MKYKNIRLVVISEKQCEIDNFVKMMKKSPMADFEFDCVNFDEKIMKESSEKEFDAVVFFMQKPFVKGFEAAIKVKNIFWRHPLVAVADPDFEDLDIGSLECIANDYIIKSKITRSMVERSIFYVLSDDRYKISNPGSPECYEEDDKFSE